MTMEEIISFVDGLDGVLTQRAHSGDGSPEIAWGDTFFYYAPDGVVPSATQPFATIVTKNYPGDETSRLDRPDVFRVNMAAGKEEFIAHVGRAPRDAVPNVDATAPWALRKTDPNRMAQVLGTLVADVRKLTEAVETVIPESADNILTLIDSGSGGQPIAQPQPLFPRLELKEEEAV